MTGENIICFAKDWSEDPTSNNHVMCELAKRNRVLWINSIATRTPSVTSARDLKKVGAKLACFTKGAQRVQDNLWTYTPIVLPLPHSRTARVFNRRILQMSIGAVRRKLNMRRFQLWCFLPNAVDYVGQMGESLVVYYCVDEWSKFNYVDGPRVAEAENRLCRSADVVFATAQSLVDDRRRLNPETHLARHGVDHELFARALDGATRVPADLATLPKPVIGFFGTLQDWVDQDLIAYLAERHPEWSIVLIGKPMVDLSKLRRFRNVHLLGRKSHAELPNYCKGFSVGMIPYVLEERIFHVNPIKLREYLSAGVPVVSVSLPEVAPFSEHCLIAKDYEAFRCGVETALRTDSPRAREARSHAMRSETWESRVAEVSGQVIRVMGLKCQI